MDMVDRFQVIRLTEHVTLLWNVT